MALAPDPAPVEIGPGRLAAWALGGLLAAGVERVSATLIDDTKPEGQGRVLYTGPLTLEAFDEQERDLRGRAWREGLSMIVKPLDTPGLVNLDDLATDQAERARPFARWILETSPGSFHACFDVLDVATKADAGRVRAAIIRALGGPANAGGGGAFRWPGSPNAKPSRRLEGGSMPMVGIERGGRSVTVDELREAGLFVEDPSGKPGTSRPARWAPSKPSATAARRGWPDHGVCLAGAPRKKNREADRSAADFNWCLLSLDRGHSTDAVEAQLERVSEYAKGKGADYISRTVENARQRWQARQN